MFWNKILIVFILFVTMPINNSKADMTDVDYLNVSDQFYNRGWIIYSAESMRKSHFLNYGNPEMLIKLKDIYKYIENSFKNVSTQEFDYQDLNLFYPEIQAANDSNIVTLSSNYKNIFGLYDILSSWPDVFSALNEARWKDEDDCNGDIVTNVHCGRESKVTYLLQYLPSSRRERLVDLRTALHSEIQFATSSKMNLNFDDILVNIFQFLKDKNVFGSLLDTRLYESGNNILKRKKLTIEAFRSLIVQVFRESGGRIITSDSLLVDLEPLSCNLDIDCTYLYLKRIFYSSVIPEGNVVTNLIYDRKMIAPLIEYYLSLSNNDKDIFEKKLYNFLKNQLDLNLLDEGLSGIEKERLVYFLSDSVDYLLKHPSVDSLKLAKRIEYFIKDISNE